MMHDEIITAVARAERRPPAVLQILPRLVTGGVERGTVDMARRWWRMAGARSSPRPAGRWCASSSAPAGPCRAAARVEEPRGDDANAARLARVIVQHRIDIVHARSRAPAWSALAASRRTGARFVTTFHNAYGARSSLKRRYNAVMARGERIIAISEFVARHLVETYGVKRELVTVVPRGVDLVRFDPERMSADRMIDLAREWGLPDGVPVVLLPGRLTRWKGHAVLIEALRRLGRGAIQCLFIGSGSERYRLELEREIARDPPPAPSACLTNAATWRPPICWPTWSCRPRPSPRGSAASSSRRRRWAGR